MKYNVICFGTDYVEYEASQTVCHLKYSQISLIQGITFCMETFVMDLKYDLLDLCGVHQNDVVLAKICHVIS